MSEPRSTPPASSQETGASTGLPSSPYVSPNQGPQSPRRRPNAPMIVFGAAVVVIVLLFVIGYAVGIFS